METPVRQPLRVLMLEDRPNDAVLLAHQLAQAGLSCTWKRVDTQQGFLQSLDPVPDIILADYTVPGFSALDALRLLREEHADVPCIVVSGTIVEEEAVACMRAGAADYLLKDRLGRLGEAVRQALDLQRLREQALQMERTVAFQAGLLDAVEQAVIATDRAGTITYWNRYAETLCGWTAAEALGREIGIIAPGGGTDPQEQAILDCLRAGASWSGEFPLVRRDGCMFPALLTLAPIFADEGSVGGMVGVCSDFTERARAREALARLAAIVESSDDAIIGESLGGTIESWNAGATRLYGYQPEEVIGKYIDLLAPADRSDEVPQLRDRVSRDIPVAHFDTVRLHQDGTPIEVSLTISPIRDSAGRVIGASTIARDIRERVRAQRAAEQARQGAEELARLHDQTAREAEAMAAVGAALAATLDLPTLYQVILEQAAKVLPCDHASVLIVEDGWLIAAASRGDPPRAPGTRILPLDGTAAGWRHRALDEPTVLADTAQDPTWQDVAPWVGEHRVRSVLTAPIRREGELLGFFGLYSVRPNFFSTDHNRLVEPFAERAAQALHNVRLHAAAQAARAHAEFESNLLQTLMDTIPDAIYFKDSNARFIRVNRAEAARCGARDPQEMVGKSDADFLPTELAQRLASKERQVLESGEPLVNDLEDQSAHAGGEQWILSTKVPIVRDGHITGLVGISRDITDVREADSARVRAESANQAKSAFLSRMSHELRTPLNAILGFGQLLELDPLSEEQQRSVAHILKAGRHLLKLINEVLEISRIEAGRLDLSLEPVGVTEVIDEACGLLLLLVQERAIHVHRPAGGHAGCYVRADRQRLQQVLINLLSNAVKYNQPGGTVRVSCSHPGADRLRIGIEDSGPGIPLEKQGRLFTPFDRLEAEQRGVEGTGMGLALSKRLVEAMGGAIGVESAAGRGSTFWVELERADPADGTCAEAALGVQGTKERSPVPRTILYIEDNLASIELINGVLAREPGVTLLSAMQGSRGLDLARTHRPDLILLDVHLPDIPGDAVLHRLQADAATRPIPVVVISADATHRQADRLTAAGARAYLTKPIDIRQFRDILASLVPREGDQGPAAMMAAVPK